ncbi:hypothetical protein J1614_011920 [Plenodomus biglobosus]|nr:hypothetical protein J1614_011920 [Plenodomus biglobosus]
MLCPQLIPVLSFQACILTPSPEVEAKRTNDCKATEDSTNGDPSLSAGGHTIATRRLPCSRRTGCREAGIGGSRTGRRFGKVIACYVEAWDLEGEFLRLDKCLWSMLGQDTMDSMDSGYTHDISTSEEGLVPTIAFSLVFSPVLKLDRSISSWCNAF